MLHINSIKTLITTINSSAFAIQFSLSIFYLNVMIKRTVLKRKSIFNKNEKCCDSLTSSQKPFRLR